MHDYDIREAMLGDIETIYGFERNYIIEHEPHMLVKWDGAKSKTLGRLKASVDNMFVATIGDDTVGHVYWSLLDNGPCIYSIYVVLEARRMGIATSLLKRCEDHIVDNGYNQVVLLTLLTNPAQQLYLDMEYIMTGILGRMDIF